MAKAPPSGSGGAGVLACDSAARRGVAIAEFSPATVASLREQLPSYGAYGNPVDVTATATDGDLIGRVLKTVAQDEQVGAIVVPLGFALYDDQAEERRRVVLEAARAVDKPVGVVWMSEWFDNRAAAPFERAPGVGLFRSMDACFEALGHWLRPPPTLPARRAARYGDLAALVPPTGATLDEGAGRQLLAAVGVPFVAQVEARGSGPDGARAALREALASWDRFPVVLKVLSADLPHKSKLGGVAVGLAGMDEVVAEAAAMLGRVAAAAPGARVDGFLVQEMLSGTQELLVGAVRDPHYGPVVAVGPGGTGAGADQPVTVVAAPVTAEAALAAVSRAPGLAHLAEPTRAALARVMRGVGDVMEALPEVREVDVNPLVVVSGSGDPVAVDALVRLDRRPPGAT